LNNDELSAADLTGFTSAFEVSVYSVSRRDAVRGQIKATYF